MTVAFIPIQVVGCGVVGDEETWPALFIEVRPLWGKPEVSGWIVDSSFLRYIGKGAVTVVVKERVSCSLQAAGTALHLNAVIFASRSAAKPRQIVQMEIDVIGDREIHQSIAVVIPERCSG
jgi:hypothetical protein